MFDFGRITQFCLKKRLSKHKMTIFSKNLGVHGPCGPPGCAYLLKDTFYRKESFPSRKSDTKLLQRIYMPTS